MRAAHTISTAPHTRNSDSACMQDRVGERTHAAKSRTHMAPPPRHPPQLLKGLARVCGHGGDHVEVHECLCGQVGDPVREARKDPERQGGTKYSERPGKVQKRQGGTKHQSGQECKTIQTESPHAQQKNTLITISDHSGAPATAGALPYALLSRCKP